MTLEEALAKYPGAQAFTFGDNATLCADLLGLVRSGVKRATCGALRDYEPGGEPMPMVGSRDIALNWDRSPALVIRTVAVTQRRFCDVDAAFAQAEGEDETLAGWQAGHRAYFERNGGWDAEMMLVCECFEMVEDFG